jgi:hypothetical protein
MQTGKRKYLSISLYASEDLHRGYKYRNLTITGTGRGKILDLMHMYAYAKRGKGEGEIYFTNLQASEGVQKKRTIHSIQYMPTYIYTNNNRVVSELYRRML